MTVAALLVWAEVVPKLINAGIVSVNQINGLIKSFHPGLTDDQLNRICTTLIAMATIHKELAQADQQPNVVRS